MTDPTTDTSKKKSPTKQELEAIVREFVTLDILKQVTEPGGVDDLERLQTRALKLLAGV